jgi:hypothetical protein
MADLTEEPLAQAQATSQVRKRKKTKPASPDIFTPTKENPYDTPEYQDLLKKLMSWRRQARIAQAENRSEMAVDEDFYDGIQLDPSDLSILIDRGQPPLVFNVIKNTLNWILGTERKTRIDSSVKPRKKKGAQSARTKTKIMKYVQDVSKGEYEWSNAFTECVKAGLGWLETGTRKTNDEPIFMRQERWRNMWFDHLGHTNDGSDWRYVFREKWVDLDLAQGLFPERGNELRVLSEAVNSLYPYLPDDIAAMDIASEFDVESDMDALYGGPYEGSRPRLKVIEAWYRTPARVKLMHMRDSDTPYGALDGAIYREKEPDHQYLVKGGYFTTEDVFMMTVRQAIWAGATLLQEMLTPYNHNRFPFTPLFCYRRSRDNMPYGCIRDLRDPQTDLNRRRSKALVLLTANRIIYEAGSFTNPVKAYDEFNSADTFLEVKEGVLSGRNKKIQVLEGAQLAASHVEMARDNENFIKSISGIQYENTGTTEKDLSGVAIKALQSQGMQSAGVFFDNYYFARQNEGEMRLSLIEQFKDKEDEYRITGEQQKDEFIKVNEFKNGKIINNITETKADFVIGKQDYRETIRLTMLSQLMELITSLANSMPEVALNLLDLAIDYMDDLPNKEDIVARIRKINGQMPPEDEVSPEEREKYDQQAAAIKQKQQKQEAIQDAMVQAKLSGEAAKTASTNAAALNKQVDTMMKKLDGFLKAIEVAASIQVAPQLVNAADNLIAEAEAVPVSGEEKQGHQPQ